MDDEARPQPQQLVEPKPLDSLGLSELRDYIAALQAEINRAEAMIARKGLHHGVAEAVFARK